MANNKHRMVKHHAWSRKFHNLFDFLTHLGLVAMRLATRTKSLCKHVRTFVDAKHCIVKYRLALIAQRVATMIFLAIQLDHCIKNFNFALPLLFYHINFFYVFHITILNAKYYQLHIKNYYNI